MCDLAAFLLNRKFMYDFTFIINNVKRQKNMTKLSGKGTVAVGMKGYCALVTASHVPLPVQARQLVSFISACWSSVLKSGSAGRLASHWLTC